jgi:hypothetical protein
LRHQNAEVNIQPQSSKSLPNNTKFLENKPSEESLSTHSVILNFNFQHPPEPLPTHHHVVGKEPEKAKEGYHCCECHYHDGND